MKVHFDLDLKRLVPAPGEYGSISGLPFIRGDFQPLKVVFLSGGAETADITDIVAVIKAEPGPASPSLAHTTDWTPGGSGGGFDSELDLGGSALDALMGSAIQKSLLFEITCRHAGLGPITSIPVAANVTGDLWRGDEESPSAAATPDDEWVAHGHAQELGHGNQLQARANIGLAGLFSPRNIAAEEELGAQAPAGDGQITVLVSGEERKVWVGAGGVWVEVSNPPAAPEAPVFPDGDWPSVAPFVGLRTTNDELYFSFYSATAEKIGVFNLVGGEWKLIYTEAFASGYTEIHSSYLTGAEGSNLFRVATVMYGASTHDGVEVLTVDGFTNAYCNFMWEAVAHIPPAFDGSFFGGYSEGSFYLHAPGVAFEHLILPYSGDLSWNLAGASVATGFDLANCGLSAAELNSIFTDLAPGSADIHVNDNPGSHTCDPSIATSKGYTVTGAS